MGFDFGALPPEYNSERMYSGAGSVPMMAAASAWNGLAAELNCAAAGYERVITTLHTEEWMGAASSSMVEAVSPYVAWMRVVAAQAEHAARQARAAAAAYETAFSGIVPPPLIAANRAQHASLVRSNTFGQNTAAIAATDARYGEMWAQDAEVMYCYAAASASASAVTPFAAPPQTTNPAAAALMAGAAAEATATAAGTTQSTLSQLISEMPSLLAGLASPSSVFASAGSSPTPGWLDWLIDWYLPISQLFYNTTGLPYFGIGIGNSLITSARALGMIGPEAAQAASAAAAAAPAAAGAAGAVGALGGGGSVAASLGNAAAVGKLSVPAAWAEAGSALHPGGAPVQVSNIVEPPDVAGSGNMLGGLPLAGTNAAASSGPRYGFRPTVMARPPFAG